MKNNYFENLFFKWSNNFINIYINDVNRVRFYLVYYIGVYFHHISFFIVMPHRKKTKIEITLWHIEIKNFLFLRYEQRNEKLKKSYNTQQNALE
jgi:hypothetical protein